MSDQAPPFFTRYGFSGLDGDAKSLEIEPYPQICEDGALLATVVASAVDIVGAMWTRAAAGHDLTFTSDLSIRIARPSIPMRLAVHGEPLRQGRRLVTTSVTLLEDGAAWGYGETTFSRIARDPARAPAPSGIMPGGDFPRHDLDRPLAEEVGVEIVDAAEGRVRVPLGPTLLNPEGVMQGALVALVVEHAARACAKAHSGVPHALVALDLRYLAGASRGPVTSECQWIGDPAEGTMRVALRDAGSEGRLTATALTRCVRISG